MFRFGPPLPAEALFDREKEWQALEHALRSLTKGARTDYALIGVRRVGKTSILNKVVEDAPRFRVIPIFVNCEGLRLDEFIALLGSTITQRFIDSLDLKEGVGYRLQEAVNKTPREAMAALSEMLGSVRTLRLKLAADYIELLLELKKKQELGPLKKEGCRSYLEDTLNLAEKIARKHQKFFVVVLDEFQTTAAYHPEFFAWMRRNTQSHTRVAYIVSGSNIGMMKDIVLDYQKPFGGNFMVQWIAPFGRETAVRFLKKSFAEEKMPISDEATNEIVSFTGGYPAYLNWIGERCVLARRTDRVYIRELEMEIFKPTNLGYLFEREVARLRKTGETKTFEVLRCMARQGISSPSQIARYIGGITASNTINYLRRLERYGYVQRTGKGRYAILDPMLEKYLKEETRVY